MSEVLLTLTLQDPISLTLTETTPIYIVPDTEPSDEPLFLASEAAHFEPGDKALLDSALQVETDPIFSAWLADTPPAYPDDIPQSLSELSEDTTHRVVTDTEKSTWNAKANALGSDDNYVTDAEKSILSVTSGVNTGDNATNTQYSGLATSKVDKVTGKSLVSDVEIGKIHTQGTDQGLDTGGANAVTAAQAKTAYTHSQSAHAPSNAVALSTVKADADIASAISLKHAQGSDLQASSDFEIADLTDVGGLRSIWSGKQDAGSYIESETDPVVGAIDGIVKADGHGIISEAVAMTDYMLPFNIYDAIPWVNNHLYAIGDIFSALEEGGATSYQIVHTSFTSDATYNLTGKESANCNTFYIQPSGSSTDEKVKFNADDPTAGYLSDKIIAGSGISVTEGTEANENKLVIANTDKGSDVVVPTALSELSDDTTHRLVTDTEKGTWNGKQDAGTYSTDIHSNITALNAVSGTNTGDSATNSTYEAVRVLPVDTNVFGFTNMADTQLSFDGTNLFTLGALNTTWSYYRSGIKYTITGNKTCTLTGTPVTTGKWYIYIDATDGTLTAFVSNAGNNYAYGWNLNDTKVPVAIIYFNNALTPKWIMANERHTCLINRRDHMQEHYTTGTLYAGGASMGTTYNLNTATAAGNTFGLTSANIFDEDLYLTLSTLTDVNGASAIYTILYRTAASAWAWTQSDMPFMYTGATTPFSYLYYDNAGTMTAVTNRYANYYVVLTSTVASGEATQGTSTCPCRFALIPGRVNTNTLATAQAEQFSSFSMTGFPLDEVVAVWQITFDTNGVATSVKGRCMINRVQRISSNVVTSTVISPVSISASNVVFAPTAGILATDVQLAIEELDTEKQASLTFGIADTNAILVNDASAADNDYAKFTATGIEGRTYTEVVTDLGVPTVSGGITAIQQITQAAYTALTPKVSTTLYIIVG